jgi:MFS family permease
MADSSLDNTDSRLAYEAPDPERPATSAPTEGELERESPAVHALDRSPAPAGHDPYAALKFPNFILFSVGWMISVIGHQMQSTALGWEIFDRTGSKLALGWVAGIQVIPVMALALPGGMLADTFDRRRIIALSGGLAAVCSLALAALSYREGSIPWMFVMLFLSSAALTIGRPARSSLMPLIVPSWAFSNAVTWNSTIFQIASMAGPAMAGLVISRSTRLVYLIDAGCAGIFALLILFTRIRRVRQSAVETRSTGNVLAGLRFVWNTRIILATMTLDLFAVLLGGAVYLLPVFAKDILHVDAVRFGWLRAAEAIGALTMSLVMAHLPPMKHAGRSMLLAVMGFGVCTIIFGLSRWFWLSFAMLLMTGALDTVSVVVRHTLVQVLTPDNMRGRVSAVNNIFIGASNELGGLESGLTAAWLGPVRSVVVGGVGTIMTVAAVALWSPQIRRYGRLDSMPESESDPPRR